MIFSLDLFPHLRWSCLQLPCQHASAPPGTLDSAARWARIAARQALEFIHRWPSLGLVATKEMVHMRIQEQPDFQSHQNRSAEMLVAEHSTCDGLIPGSHVCLSKGILPPKRSPSNSLVGPMSAVSLWTPVASREPSMRLRPNSSSRPGSGSEEGDGGLGMKHPTTFFNTNDC